MSYEPSKFWTTLNKKSDEFLEEYGYENFKRTVGVIYNDYFYDHDKKKLPDDYEDQVRAIWDRMYEVYSNGVLGYFHEPDVGNPLGIIYRGRLVSIDLAASISELSLLSAYIDLSAVKVIHEIGGGYGRLAYVIGQIVPCVYRLYDLDMSRNLAQRYLKDVLPNRPLEFYSPDKLEGKCDILIAMDCLHEMTVEQVHSYFDYAHENAKYFYYTCWKDTTIQEDQVRWTQDKYPVKESWQPIYVGQHRIRTQFFEALYKI